MKCLLCEQRKAKRFCPAKNGLICAQCCGEKRVLEIDCPESCPYLKSARERENEAFGNRLRHMDGKIQRSMMQYQETIAQLEYFLGRERLSDRTLTDKDVVDAVSVLLETYRTEDKGVLYERTSDNLRIEALRRDLKKIIESWRNPEGEQARGIVDPKSTRLQLSEAIVCLETIKYLAESYLEDRGSPSGYVDFLARLFPREGKRGSIVMP